MRKCLFVLIMICLCQCNRSDRDRIVFHNDIREVKDSLLVTMKFMDAFLRNNNISHYLWSRNDSTLYIGAVDLDNYVYIYNDTLTVMKNVPRPIRERFVNLILFLKRNDIDECGWDNIGGTWGFGYKAILIDQNKDNRHIYINVNDAIYKNIQEENNILDEREGLILVRPDYEKFNKRRGPVPWDKYK